MAQKHINRIVIIMLFSIYGLFCFAGKESVSYYQRINRITANSFSLQENKYLIPYYVYSGAATNTYIKNAYAKVSLKIFDTIPNSISNLSSLAVNQSIYFSITGYDFSGTSLGTVIQQLNVSNLYTAPNSLADVKDIDMYVFNGAHKVDVQLTDAFGNPLSVSTLSTYKMNLAFEIEIDIDRYYQFDRSSLWNVNSGGQVGHNVITNTFSGLPEALEVYWDNMVGAEEYDLEWAFVDDYSTTLSTFQTGADINTKIITFSGNSTRITTTGNYHRIPLVFEHGYLIYRVRGVGRSIINTDVTLEGSWSLLDKQPFSYYSSNSVCVYQVTNIHENDNKNWQYNATFAEDGKRKHTVTYADGSLRSRQIITQNNSDKTVIIGQTIYDYQGRKALDLLPVPDPDAQNIFSYHSGFAKNAAGAPYSKADFDLDIATSGTGCDMGAPPLNTSFGAGKYYSSNNLLTGKNSHRQYTPDAFGYSFVQTEYKADNTGRIKNQGGVGDNHHIGTNHQTKYLYGSPDQEEIDALFGSEVGYYMHYQKNVVIDANGQTSIAYVDLKGKTVATALAGTAPTGMMQITAPAPASFDAHYINDQAYPNNINGNTSIDNALVFNKQIVVESATTYNISYDVKPEEFTTSCAVGSTICYDCVYELNISLKDECKNEKIPTSTNITGYFSPSVTGSNALVGDVSESGTTGAYTFIAFKDNGCNNIASGAYSPAVISAALTPGEYTLTKSLKVSKDAMEFYLQQYLQSNCIQPLSAFTTSATAAMDTSACNVPCLECLDSPTLCEANYKMLISDVSLGGQYAGYEINNGVITAGDAFSLLNESNSFPKISSDFISYDGSVSRYNPSWRHPIVNGISRDYEYENGMLAYAPVNPADYTSTPGVVQLLIIDPVSGYLVTPSSGLGNIAGVLIKDLKDLTAFKNAWHPNFARFIVEYHPEFSYYQFCITQSGKSEHYFPKKLTVTSSTPLGNLSTYSNYTTYKTNFEAQWKGTNSFVSKNLQFNTPVPVGGSLNTQIVTGSPSSLSSEQFDEQLKTYVTSIANLNTFCNSSTTFVNDILNTATANGAHDLINIDPYFDLCSTNPLIANHVFGTKTAEILFYYKQKLLSKMQFAPITTASGISVNNVKQAFMLSVADPICNFQNVFYPTTLPTGCGTTINNDAIWNRYKDFYVSNKQQIILEMADEFAKVSEYGLAGATQNYLINSGIGANNSSSPYFSQLTNHTYPGDLTSSNYRLIKGYNGCIGNPTFDANTSDFIRFGYNPKGSNFNHAASGALVDPSYVMTSAPINYIYPLHFAQEVGFQSNYYNYYSAMGAMTALPWSSSIACSPSQGWGYYDRGQTCNADLVGSFQTKTKRFQSGLGYAQQTYNASSPQDLMNILASQVPVQNQMLSGICPVANDFKALLNNLTQGILNGTSSYNLTTNSPLWVFPGLTKLLYDNIINSSCSSSYVFLQAKPVISSGGNVLTVSLGGNISNAGYASSTVFGSISSSCLNCSSANLVTLTKTNTAYSFGNIVSIDNITSINGGNFSLNITYKLPSGSGYAFYTDIITGTTCLPLDGCISAPTPQVCVTTQFSKDFVKLLSALGSTNGSASAYNIDLFDTSIPGVDLNGTSAVSYLSFLSPSIYAKMGGSTAAANLWKWKYSGGIFHFSSATSTAGFDITISGLLTPSGYVSYAFSNLRSIAGIASIDVTITDLTTYATSTATYPITIKELIGNTFVSLLDCHSLLNPLCDKIENQNYEEVKKLLVDILPLYPSSGSSTSYNSNITNFSTFTNSLKSQLAGGVNGTYYLSRPDYASSPGFLKYSIGFLKPGYSQTSCSKLDPVTNTPIWSYSDPTPACIQICCEISIKASNPGLYWDNIIYLNYNSFTGNKDNHTYCTMVMEQKGEISTCWAIEPCCTVPMSASTLLSSSACTTEYNAFVTAMNAITASANNVVTNNAASNVLTNTPYLFADSYVPASEYCNHQYYAPAFGTSSKLSDIYIQYYQVIVPKISYINSFSAMWTNPATILISPSNPLSDPSSKFFLALGEFANIQNINMLYAYETYVTNYNPNTKNPDPLMSFSQFLQTNPTLSTCGDACQKPLNMGQTPSQPVGWNTDCVQELEALAAQNALIQYQQYLNVISSDFRNAYITKCLQAKENLNTNYMSNRYHFTLYYYDQAGNLIKTVPPNGVVPYTSPADLALVVNTRNSGGGTPKVPAHGYSTLYKYNSLNQLTQQTMPDHDYVASSFYYDKLGRLVLSQNPKQKHSNTSSYAGLQQYSYTKYDALGRIREVGEANSLPAALTTGATPVIITGVNQITSDATFAAWLAPVTKQQITSTIYDYATLGSTTFQNDLMRGRVAKTSIDVDGDGVFENASHFSYDVHGNVKSMINQYNYKTYENIANKRIDYEYDLISGKVNAVCYQNAGKDKYSHKYYYDADNRIIEVQTSKDGYIWNKDAKYYYYLHGPLARTEIGDRKVQGLDYYYTIQGWIKGVNGESFMRKYDPGKDGFIESTVSGASYNYLANTANIHKNVGIDAFAYSLGYFEETGTSGSAGYMHKDYIPIKDAGIESLTTPYANTKNNFTSINPTNVPNLYNGNIKHMSSVIVTSALNKADYYRKGDPAMQIFQYDQLNRIKGSGVSFNYNAYGASLMNTNATYENQYVDNNPLLGQSSYTYDANGNITNLKRKYITLGTTNVATLMDNMSYTYSINTNPNTTNPYNIGTATSYNTNKLDNVNDGITTTGGLGLGDFQNGQAVQNYAYDEIGNLTKDVQEQIQNITWNVYGKIESITRVSTSTKSDLEFRYDAKGDRIMKIEKKRTSGVLDNNDKWLYTTYVRDAQGNVMSVYESKYTSPSAGNYQQETQLAESDIYGSSRLGLEDRHTDLITDILPFTATSGNFAGGANITGYNPTLGSVSPMAYFSRNLGNKNYELSNHLGNVMTTISDRKIAIDDGTPSSDYLSYTGASDGKTDYYIADITSSTDYYPFGSPMPGRQFVSSSTYRYGFNGKENDKETVGTGQGTQDYGMRIYNPALGRFLSVDPLSKSYPWSSNYAFAENDVIRCIDLDGLEKSFRHYVVDNYGIHTLIKETKWSDVFPGQEHGPKGLGTTDFVYDVKTKKFGEGQYKPTYAEENPVKDFFGSEYNGRYDDEKGLKQLGKDIKTGGKALGKSSTYVKLGGVVVVIGGAVTAQPEIVAGGVLIYNAGGRMEDVAAVIAITSAGAEGDVSGALTESAKFATGKVIGKSIEGTSLNEGNKVVTDYLSGKAVDAIGPKEEEESNKTKEIEKEK